MTRHKEKNHGPQIPYCEERHKLTDALVAAAHELTEVQNQQVQAIIEGDADFCRFDDLIHVARATKDQAKYALLAHIEQHHC
jgi:hypothetical protein